MGKVVYYCPHDLSMYMYQVLYMLCMGMVCVINTLFSCYNIIMIACYVFIVTGCTSGATSSGHVSGKQD